MKLRAIVMAIFAASPASGDAGRPSVAEAMTAIVGTEVSISGKYGKDDDRSVLFHSDGGWYAVDLAVDRETNKALSGCRNRGPSPPSCYIKGAAEIAVEGNSIRLIIFEVSEISSENPN